MKAPSTNKQLLEMMWERFPEIMRRGLEQPEQEPPSEWSGIKAILDEYGLQAIDFVATFKQALAQPEQEPVAWLDPKGDQYCNVITDAWKKHLRAHTTRLEKEHAAKHTVPAFTTPPKRPWVGLTPDEINECYGRSWADLNCEVHTAVEAKLKELNT